jgi:hypoxanthine phosphoribosyltransferase
MSKEKLVLSSIIVPKEKITLEITKLAKFLNTIYRYDELYIICILKGAVFFFTDLVRQLTIPVTYDFIEIKSYKGVIPGNIEMAVNKTLAVYNKNVLIVEDIVDTGKTLYYLQQELNRKSPKSLKTVILLNKQGPEIGYSCFNLFKNDFVVGYGLDYDQQYRNLPDIHIMEEKL